MLDLPEPLGPVMTVNPVSRLTETFLLKVLNPRRSILLMNTKARALDSHSEVGRVLIGRIFCSASGRVLSPLRNRFFETRASKRLRRQARYTRTATRGTRLVALRLTSV